MLQIYYVNIFTKEHTKHNNYRAGISAATITVVVTKVVSMHFRNFFFVLLNKTNFKIKTVNCNGCW